MTADTGEMVAITVGTRVRVCGDAHGGEICGQRATTTLHVRYKGAGWEQFDRCSRHPAAEMAAAVRRWDPQAEIRITTAGGTR